VLSPRSLADGGALDLLGLSTSTAA
jgi:hypothetical protein